MRLSVGSTLLLSLLVLSFTPGAPSAAAPGLKPAARAKVPAARPAAQTSLSAPTSPPSLVAAPAPSLDWPPRPALRGLGQAGAGLTRFGQGGLRAQTDSAPICRSQCATVRYRCLAGAEAEACDGNWTRCVIACREPSQP